ncbi:MAG: SDR family NAD(P)-dependent oxidoreductase [Flavobacteriales bacterium]
MNILVTGGVSGLGKAITQKLAKEFPHKTVYATYHSSQSAAQELERAFSNVKGIHCDFTSAESVGSLLSQLESLQLEIVVNNALTGIEQKHFHKIAPSFFVESFQNNIMPAIQIAQVLIPYFRKQKSGRFINILSSYVIGTPPLGMSEYVAAKCYLHSLSNSWAAENSKYNIVSNCLSPSIMRTGLTKETDERIFEEIEAASALKRLLTVEETAEAVHYLCNASAEVNGKNIEVSAGDKWN